MSSWRFIFRSLAHHWRMNVAVALGVIAATAVLTGALLVGDSMRGSLRHLTLDRLGRIDEILVSSHFFRQELAEELASSEGFQKHYELAAAAIVFPRGSVERKYNDPVTQELRTSRAAGILVIGCDKSFWDLEGKKNKTIRPNPLPQENEIALNEPLAGELGVKVGDEVTLRLVNSAQVPADSPLGKKEIDARSLSNLKVVAIIPAESLGGFALRPSQSVPRNAYVSIGSLQERFDQPGKANAIFVAGKFTSHPPEKEASQELAKVLRPSFEDYGFRLTRVRRTFPDREARREFPELADVPEKVVYDYLSFSSDRMVIDSNAETAAEHAFGDAVQPVFTYLANRIEKISGDSPEKTVVSYSTITAIDSTPSLGPLFGDGKPIELDSVEGTNYIVLNSWAADELAAKPKDKIRITYFDPETTHGKTNERSTEFELKAVAPIAQPKTKYARKRNPAFQQEPTWANDPDLTPVVEGITDQASISGWEVPFTLDESIIRPEDEDYWDYHRTTPKGFVSLAVGQKLWGSRFGRLTSFRIPWPKDFTEERSPQIVNDLKEKFLDQVQRDGASLGFEFIPVKRHGLRPSVVANYFNGLFLGFSMFIIAAALMLVALLFRLGIEQRASEIGILQAVGLRRRLTARMLSWEGTIVAAMGGVLGVAVGIAYAWLMIVGLKTWWVGAVASPFLQLHLSNPWSLLIGYASGVLVSILTIRWSIRQTRKLSVRGLLSGKIFEQTVTSRAHTAASQLLHVGTFLLFAGAIALLLFATRLSGEAQAGAFMGGGACVLTSMLTLIWVRMRYTTAVKNTGGLALGGLARRNASRNPSRSTLTMGLIASASFLIVAVGSFRLAPTDEGTGGFTLMADSDPIYKDLNDTKIREEFLGKENNALLEKQALLSLRLKPGDDASCSNLYESTSPRVIGITPAMMKHFNSPEVQHFAWAANAAATEEEKINPWRLLSTEKASSDNILPVVIDKNTAMYSLQLYKGIGEEFDVEYDGVIVKFRVVGLLANSILQGSLLIGEADFVDTFPEVNGYRFHLIQSSTEHVEKVSAVLEDRMSDQLFDVQETRDVLATLLAVQNTYLDTFQSLGALGLLLGTFGLATVQLRNVFERRGELALLRASGFRRSRLAGMVMTENVLLLVGGLAIGILSALLAVVPHWFAGGASVPGVDLAIKLGFVLAIGLLSGLAAVRAVLRAPLLSALRGD